MLTAITDRSVWRWKRKNGKAAPLPAPKRRKMHSGRRHPEGTFPRTGNTGKRRPYTPHQSHRECQRRRNQIASGQITGLFA